MANRITGFCVPRAERRAANENDAAIHPDETGAAEKLSQQTRSLFIKVASKENACHSSKDVRPRFVVFIRISKPHQQLLSFTFAKAPEFVVFLRTSGVLCAVIVQGGDKVIGLGLAVHRGHRQVQFCSCICSDSAQILLRFCSILSRLKLQLGLNNSLGLMLQRELPFISSHGPQFDFLPDDEDKWAAGGGLTGQ